MTIGALLLAGGLGTRLHPLTEHLPKPMIPVLGKPLLHRIVTSLVDQGINDIVMAIGYQGDIIRQYFGDGSQFGCRIRYSQERQPLGTGGAIGQGGSYFQQTFLVLNADIYQDFDLSKLLSFHRQVQALTTIGLITVNDPRSYGLVELDRARRVQRFTEKPATVAEVTSPYVNAGLYVMEPAALAYIPPQRKTSVERETFPALLRANEPVYGFPLQGYWHDLGTRDRYLEGHRDLLLAQGVKRQIAPGVILETGVKLEPPLWVGPGCRIESGAEIGPYAVLGRNCWVGSGAKIQNSVLWERVRVGNGAWVNGSVVGNDVSVPPVGSLENLLVS